jgi:outer membrane receptor protein involved in Fe transport
MSSLLHALLCLAAAAGKPADGRPTDERPAAEAISLEALLDIVVSATLREQSAVDAPAAITVVGAADIRARGYRTLKAIMNDVPGWNDVSDVNEEIVGVRGLFASTTNKILILVNGHRMNDLMLGRYNVDQYLGMQAVERVEFIRGPVSALYGSGALIGVVNVITRRGGDLGGAEGYLRAGAHGQEASATWGTDLGGYDLLFNFTFLDARGQTLAQPAALDSPPEGQAPRPGDIYLGRYRENLSALFTARSAQATLQLRAAHFRRVPPRGARGALYVYREQPFKPAYTENDAFVDYSGRFDLAGDRLRLTVNPSVHFFSYYEQSFITFGAERVPPLGERSGMQGEFNNYQLKLTLEHQPLPGLDLTAGLDGLLASFYRSDAVTIMGGEVVVTPQGYTALGRWFVGGAFLQAVWSPWRPVALTAGLRYDTFQREADAELTPRLGLVLKPMDALAVKLLYGRSYLAPMWAHKRANDGDFLGSPDLMPESFTGLDLVVAHGDRRGTASVDFFYNAVDGLINSVPDPQTMRFSYLNSADSVYYGVEIAGDRQLLPWLRLQGSYSFIRPRRGATSPSLLVDGHIKDIAHHSLRYGVRLLPLAGLDINVWGRAYAVTRTDDPITMDSSVPAVAVLDASVGYTVGRVTLQIIGTNLTDRYYERGGTTPRPLARERLDVDGAVTVRF